MAFAGHVLRGSSGKDLLDVLEGKLNCLKEDPEGCGWMTLKVGLGWTPMRR